MKGKEYVWARKISQTDADCEDCSVCLVSLDAASLTVMIMMMVMVMVLRGAVSCAVFWLPVPLSSPSFVVCEHDGP